MHVFLQILLLATSGCSKRYYERELVNEYHVCRISQSTVTVNRRLASGSSVLVVPPRVVGVYVSGSVIVGEAEYVEHASAESVAGFFIVETEVHRVHVGLSKKEYEDALTKIGISQVPKLLPP